MSNRKPETLTISRHLPYLLCTTKEDNTSLFTFNINVSRTVYSAVVLLHVNKTQYNIDQVIDWSSMCTWKVLYFCAIDNSIIVLTKIPSKY